MMNLYGGGAIDNQAKGTLFIELTKQNDRAFEIRVFELRRCNNKTVIQLEAPMSAEYTNSGSVPSSTVVSVTMTS